MEEKGGFSSEEFVEKLKEEEIKKQKEEELKKELDKNSYLKDTPIEEILKNNFPEEEKEEKEFDSEAFFEKLKDKQVKEEEKNRK
jgi:hypothetical protein